MSDNLADNRKKLDRLKRELEEALRSSPNADVRDTEKSIAFLEAGLIDAIVYAFEQGFSVTYEMFREWIPEYVLRANDTSFLGRIISQLEVREVSVPGFIGELEGIFVSP